MTLEQIRAALPTHIMLPKECKTKHADSVCTTIVETGMSGGEIQYAEVELLAREVPSDILDNQAYWMWHSQFTGKADGWPVSECGGLEAFSAHFASGRLYDKWLLEQMEG